MAHKGDMDPLGYSVWSFNFGAKPSGSGVYTGHGVIWTSADGNNGDSNKWNYYSGIPSPDGSMSTSGQVDDATDTLNGNTTVIAPIAHNESTLNFRGYISSNALQNIYIETDVYGFGADTGHAYVYTAQGQGLNAAVLEGITGVSTATPTVSYTWYESSTGITYDVQEYFVWSSVADSMSFNLTGGSINALQLTPLPPHPLHPVPEPGTATLLGVGALAGLLRRKRKYSAEA